MPWLHVHCPRLTSPLRISVLADIRIPPVSESDWSSRVQDRFPFALKLQRTHCASENRFLAKPLDSLSWARHSLTAG